MGLWRSRFRRVAFVAAVGVVLGLLAAPASAAPTMSLSVAAWSRSEPQGLLTYDFTFSTGDLTGADSACKSYCKYNVSGYYYDGTTYKYVHLFAQNTDWKIYPSLTLRYTGTSAAMREITHLRAYMWNGSDQTIDSGYIQVDTPRTHSLDLSVASWSRNDATGTLTYDFTITGRNLWAESSPCRSYCQYLVALYHPNGTGNAEVHRFGSSGGWYMYRALDLRYTLTNANIREGTLLRAYLWDGSTPQKTIDTGYLTVDHARSPSLHLAVDKWKRLTPTSVAYDVTVEGDRLWAYDSICKSYCYYRVQAIRKDAVGETVVASLATDTTWRMYPQLRLHPVSAGATMGAVTHLRATLVNGSAQQMVAEVPVSDDVAYSVDVNEATAKLLALTAAKRAVICEPFLFHPVHTQGTSTPDAYNDCERLRLMGDMQKLVQALVDLYGAAAVLSMMFEAGDDPGDEPSPPPVPDPLDPFPSRWDSTLGDFFMERLTERMITRSPQKVLLMTRVEAEQAADQCVKQVAIAARTSLASAWVPGRHPCERLAIFLPGSDVESATQHDHDALFVAHSPDGGSRHPEWLFLNYQPAAAKVASGVSRSWYSAYDCGEPTTGNSCDEYPYFASSQGGPGTPLPSLRRIDQPHNELEGSRYGTFIRTCRLLPDQQFLVIPMAFDGAPSTKAVCL